MISRQLFMHSLNFLGDYPYLCFSFLLLAVFFVTFALGKRFRPLMAISGVASALYSLTAVFFVPEYWQPVLVVESVVGVEDTLFSFANGGIVIFMSLWPVRNRVSVRYTPLSLLMKFFFWSMLGAVLCYLFRKAGATIMACCLCAMVIIGFTLILKNKRHWPLCLVGAVGFTLLYMAVTGVLGVWFPRFYTQWTLKNLLGVRFLSFPVEEYFWAFGFGAVFPMLMARAFGLTLTEAKTAKAAERVKDINGSG